MREIVFYSVNALKKLQKSVILGQYAILVFFCLAFSWEFAIYRKLLQYLRKYDIFIMIICGITRGKQGVYNNNSSPSGFAPFLFDDFLH